MGICLPLHRHRHDDDDVFTDEKERRFINKQIPGYYHNETQYGMMQYYWGPIYT